MSEAAHSERTPDPEADSLLAYWFAVAGPDPESWRDRNRRWFMSSAEQDRALEERFGALAQRAADGELDHWAATPRGRLALIILLDQLPRNLHRSKPQAFAQDSKALELCLAALQSGQADELAPIERGFLLMPLQHAESKEVQDLAVAKFAALAAEATAAPLKSALQGFADYARQHRDIVARFGRFPHRNDVLGRQPTVAEIEFLRSGGPSFGQPGRAADGDDR